VQAELICSNKNLVEQELLDFKYYASHRKIHGVCFPSSLISYHKDIILPRKTIGLVDYPFGLATTTARQAEAIYCVRSGVRIIEFVINHYQLINHRLDDLIKDAKAIINIAHDENIGVRAIIEHRLLQMDNILELTEILYSLGIESVVTATGTMANSFTDTLLVSKFLGEHKMKAIAYGVFDGKQIMKLKEVKTFGIRFSSIKAAENILGKVT
jgi:deoxyribose-phosphate aldolase